MNSFSLRIAGIGVAALSIFAACAAPTDVEPGSGAETAEQAATASGTPRANEVRVTTVDVPVTSQTLTRTSLGIDLVWTDMWRYTALAHSPTLQFEASAFDGVSCDDACVAAVVARATALGGKLRGKLRVERRISGIQKAPGVCVRVLQERVSLDLRTATHGINPDLEERYGFLTLDPDPMPVMIEIGSMPCQ